jgi:hypothetical protein
MRTVLLLLLSFLVSAAFAAETRKDPLTMDDLYGRWVPDWKALAPQDAKAELTAAYADMAVSLTPRIGRIFTKEDEDMLVGLWRIEDAKPSAGTILIQSKGGVERRLPFSYDGKHLQLDGLSVKVPLMKEAAK